ncbi:MAG: CopG family ribbon-helix-helix protein [Petrotogales bacterium]
MTKKMISFRIDTKLLNKLDKMDKSRSDVIHTALELYVERNTKRNTERITPHEDNRDNECITECNTTPIQITENQKFMEYLERDHEWLKDRIEFFEQLQKEKKQEKELREISWFRV